MDSLIVKEVSNKSHVTEVSYKNSDDEEQQTRDKTPSLHKTSTAWQQIKQSVAAQKDVTESLSNHWGRVPSFLMRNFTEKSVQLKYFVFDPL